MQTVHAVTPEVFAGKFWKHPGHYAYAAQMHIVPVAAQEINTVVGHLPLAFVQIQTQWQMVAMMSYLPNSNFLIGPEGRWLGSYVPAMLRAYPFSLARGPNAEDGQGQYVLCAPNEGPHLVEKGQGEPFFLEDEQPSAATMRAMNFLANVDTGRGQIERGLLALVQAGVVVPWDLSVNQDGKERKLTGLYRLDEIAFSALDHKTLVRLQQEGSMPIAYAQLYAREQLPRLQQYLAIQQQLRTPPASAESAKA